MNRRAFLKKAAMLPVVGALILAAKPEPQIINMSDAVGELTVEYGEVEGPLQMIPDHTHSISHSHSIPIHTHELPRGNGLAEDLRKLGYI